MTDPNPRAGAAAKILAHPADYKVCEGCGSIVLKKALLCSRDASSVTKDDYN